MKKMLSLLKTSGDVVADSIDEAQAAEQARRDDLLARRMRLPLSNQDTGPSHCRDCGEVIPPERRQAVPGVARCADCATDHERQARQRRR